MTDGEIEWVKIKMKNNKDLLIGSFYMPHREQKHLEELKKSLEAVDQQNVNNIVICGDFNCPDINWTNLTASGQDRELQQGLADLMGTHNLNQIHETPTREGNLLDLVFVSNPTLVKSLVNVPGISDHDIIITDFETKVHHQSNIKRKCYIYSKANWDNIHDDLTKTDKTIRQTTKRSKCTSTLGYF